MPYPLNSSKNLTYTVVLYTILFVNGETELQSTEVAYGETPVYTCATPVREADALYTYVFKGWEPAITAVTGDAVYTAEFLRSPNGSGGSGTVTDTISIASARYDASRSVLDLAGESTLGVVHFKVFQGENAVSSEGFASVTDGKYSSSIRVEGLAPGVYTLKAWGSSSATMATMAFRVGESSGTETVVPSGTGDEITVTPAETEASIEILPENGTLKIETSESVGISVSKSDVEKLNDKDASLEVTLSEGSVLLDKGVLSNLAGKDGSDVKLSLKVADTSSLDGKVKDLIKDSPVFDISLSVGGSNVSVLNGTATVTLDYVLKNGDDPAKLSVWCISDNGTVEEFACVYNGDGTVTFSTPHFSKYAVVYDLVIPGDNPVPGPAPGPSPAPVDDTSGDGGVLVYALVGIVVAVLAVVGALLVRRRA